MKRLERAEKEGREGMRARERDREAANAQLCILKERERERGWRRERERKAFTLRHQELAGLTECDATGSRCCICATSLLLRGRPASVRVYRAHECIESLPRVCVRECV